MRVTLAGSRILICVFSCAIALAMNPPGLLLPYAFAMPALGGQNQPPPPAPGQPSPGPEQPPAAQLTPQ